MAYGSISKTGENKFRVCFDYGKDGSGKRIRKYQTFSSKREAEHALNRHKVEMDTGNFVMPADWTFAQWMDFWYDNIILPQIEATTAYGYKSIIENHLKPQLGNCKLQKLSARHIQLYYTHLLNEVKLSPNSVLKHHNLLTNILNAAKRYEYITKNPMDAVSPPKKRRREAKYYTPEQLGQLLALAAGTRLELPIYICAYLGLRRGELCGLRWQDIDFEHHTVTIDTTRTQAGKDEIVKDTKTVSSTRTLYLPDTLYQMLQAEKAHQAACKAHLKNMYDDNPYVVVMENGKPFRPNYLSELFTKFLADNGLPKSFCMSCGTRLPRSPTRQVSPHSTSVKRLGILRPPQRRKSIRICLTKPTSKLCRALPQLPTAPASRPAVLIWILFRPFLHRRSTLGIRCPVRTIIQKSAACKANFIPVSMQLRSDN